MKYSDTIYPICIETMLFIEFERNIHSGLNIVKYREVTDDALYYLYIDMETLHLLITNYGILSTYKIPTVKTNCDNPSTSKTIQLKYCGADIELHCGSGISPFCILPHLEQNY